MNKPPTVADVRGILKPYKRIDEMAELRAEVERLRAALISARDFANSERRNTALLLSNPPQSSAAWNIRNHIDAALGEEKKG